LGEVKFYDDVKRAITDVVEELTQHTQRDYLRSEFTAITNKLDATWGEAAQLRELIHQNTSLDRIFASVCIPVLLTYDSDAVAGHQSVCAAYEAAFTEEVLRYHSLFASKVLPTNVTVRLFLLPLRQKIQLVKDMDEALKACQAAL
jgi:hypothetical protein